MNTYRPPTIVVTPHDADADATVVWLGGEHDEATRGRLARALAEASQLEGDVVVDLSDVTFMDASTVGALVGAGQDLRQQSRSFGLRSPSPSARRALELCGFGDAVTSAPALRSWVDVPALPANAEVKADAEAIDLVKVERGGA
jgi:anti-anti-sigma factor